jgi:hypothetical protein
MKEEERLIYTSVDDMQSSLQCSLGHESLSLETLRKAKILADQRGEKTRTKILDRFIRKLEKGKK